LNIVTASNSPGSGTGMLVKLRRAGRRGSEPSHTSSSIRRIHGLAA